MEKLNEYLQTLLSSCSDELRLEPDKNPYLVSENRNRDVTKVPLMGTQISTMVFPLIPPDVKSALPHNYEVEFVHPHNLGNFNFNVQKSPAGFNVTIRPMLSESGGSIRVPTPLPEVAPAYTAELGTPYVPEPAVETQTAFEPTPVVDDLSQPAYEFESSPQAAYDLESSSIAYDQTSQESVDTATVPGLMLEQPQTAEEYVPTAADTPEIEVVSVNDPQFQTVFSDSSAYEPPGRRDDFELGQYIPPPPPPAAPAETFSVPQPEAVSHTPNPLEPRRRPLSRPPPATRRGRVCSRRGKRRQGWFILLSKWPSLVHPTCIFRSVCRR